MENAVLVDRFQGSKEEGSGYFDVSRILGTSKRPFTAGGRLCEPAPIFRAVFARRPLFQKYRAVAWSDPNRSEKSYSSAVASRISFSVA